MLRILTLRIGAPVADVWTALTDPAIVTRWAGVTPVHLPASYPRHGDYALWRDGPTLLHDEIIRVEPERRLTSRLRFGSALVIEEYTLRPEGRKTTHLRATWRGHPALADGNADGMRRLAALVRRPAGRAT